MERINILLQKMELFIGKILIGVILIVSTLQIICRYVLKMPLSWTEEVAGYSLVWVTFLSMSYLYSKWSHIGLTIINNRLSERTNLILKIIFSSLIGIGMMYLIPKAISCFAYMVPTPALKIPQQYFFVIVPVGFGLISFHSLFFVWEGIKLLSSMEEN